MLNLIYNHEKNSDYMKFFQMKKSKFGIIMITKDKLSDIRPYRGFNYELETKDNE